MTRERVLSRDQQAAVDCDDPAIVLVASAGSGKTEVVARRVERLLLGSPKDGFRVLALSYTVKAADELRNRFKSRLGDLARRVDTNTIHGFAHHLLRQHGTRIGLPVEPEVLTRDEDRAEVLARWLDSGGQAPPSDMESVLRELDLARAQRRATVYIDDWHAALEAMGALDYSSMLTRAEELLSLPSQGRQLARLYGHVILDEAQNLTPAQYSLLRTLLGSPDRPRASSMVVGDDKQSIVGFAGAEPGLINVYANDYGATRFELLQNFRSAGAIVRLGDVVAAQLGSSSTGDNVAYAAPGLVLSRESPGEQDEGRAVAQWVAELLRNGIPDEALAPGESTHVRPEEIAILGRSAAALQATQDALADLDIDTAVASTPEDWLSTAAGKIAFEIVALQSASSHQSTHWQLARLLEVAEEMVQTPQAVADVIRSHADKLIGRLEPLCSVGEPAAFIDALSAISPPPDAVDDVLASWDADCEQLARAWRGFAQQATAVERTWGNFRLYVSRLQRGDDLDAGVRLVTIHKAQGREYRAVVVVGLNDGQLPDFRATTPDELTSELRTFYVAVTRPSRALMLSRARARPTRYGMRSTTPSRYLDLLATSELP